MIFACEHHDEVLDHWRREDRRGIRLAHVDFHDDLRGLLVDRRRSRAYPIRSLARAGAGPDGDRGEVDAGNFLAHAVLERRLDGVRWVHGTPGGRGWDVGIVRYETDLLALPDRLRHRWRGDGELPFAFEEIAMEDWNGPAPDELLSVDWDCFASVLQDRDGIADRVEAFFERLGPHVPPAAWAAYSPEYSHDTLDLFVSFVERLADRCGQPVHWLSPGLEHGRLTPREIDARLPRGPVMRLVLRLRRMGLT